MAGSQRARRPRRGWPTRSRVCATGGGRRSSDTARASAVPSGRSRRPRRRSRRSGRAPSERPTPCRSIPRRFCSGGRERRRRCGRQSRRRASSSRRSRAPRSRPCWPRTRPASISPADQDRLRQHLARCPACQATQAVQAEAERTYFHPTAGRGRSGQPSGDHRRAAAGGTPADAGRAGVGCGVGERRPPGDAGRREPAAGHGGVATEDSGAAPADCRGERLEADEHAGRAVAWGEAVPAEVLRGPPGGQATGEWDSPTGVMSAVDLEGRARARSGRPSTRRPRSRTIAGPSTRRPRSRRRDRRRTGSGPTGPAPASFPPSRAAGLRMARFEPATPDAGAAQRRPVPAG